MIRGNPALTAIPDLSGLDSLQELAIIDNRALIDLPDLSDLEHVEPSIWGNGSQ